MIGADSRVETIFEPNLLLIKWNLHKFADSSNRSEKVEKAVWLAAHIGMFPIEVFFPLAANLRKFHKMARHLISYHLRIMTDQTHGGFPRGWEFERIPPERDVLPERESHAEICSPHRSSEHR